jgi:hypothetical protein
MHPEVVWRLQDDSCHLFVCFVMKTLQIRMSRITTLLTQVENTCHLKEDWSLQMYFTRFPAYITCP